MRNSNSGRCFFKMMAIIFLLSTSIIIIAKAQHDETFGHNGGEEGSPPVVEGGGDGNGGSSTGEGLGGVNADAGADTDTDKAGGNAEANVPAAAATAAISGEESFGGGISEGKSSDSKDATNAADLPTNSTDTITNTTTDTTEDKPQIDSTKDVDETKDTDDVKAESNPLDQSNESITDNIDGTKVQPDVSSSILASKKKKNKMGRKKNNKEKKVIDDFKEIEEENVGTDENTLDSLSAKEKNILGIKDKDGELSNVDIKISEEKEQDRKSIFNIDEDLYMFANNAATGSPEKIYALSSDSSRFATFVQGNANLLRGHEILAADILISKNIDAFWLEGVFSYLRSNFKTIATIPAKVSGNVYSEINNPRPDNSKQELISAGMGVGYRFLFPDQINVFSINNMFQTVSAYLTFNRLSEFYSAKTYLGLGLRTDYGVHQRISPSIHWGPKFSYHLAEVSRAELVAAEGRNDRILFLSWFTIGVEFAIYP